jgi:hypothetical protein
LDFNGIIYDLIKILEKSAESSGNKLRNRATKWRPIPTVEIESHLTVESWCDSCLESDEMLVLLSNELYSWILLEHDREREHWLQLRNWTIRVTKWVKSVTFWYLSLHCTLSLFCTISLSSFVLFSSGRLYKWLFCMRTMRYVIWRNKWQRSTISIRVSYI